MITSTAKPRGLSRLLGDCSGEADRSSRRERQQEVKEGGGGKGERREI